jgi:hypothetical protein
MWIVSLLCIVLGLAVAIFDASIFMPPLPWFVLAIAFSLLSPGSLPFARRRR